MVTGVLCFAVQINCKVLFLTEKTIIESKIRLISSLKHLGDVQPLHQSYTVVVKTLLCF